MRARISPLRGPLRSTSGALRVPGDKSISHRALLFAALAEGESRIAGLAPGGDVRSTAQVLAQLGVPLLRGDGTPWSSSSPAFVALARPPGALPLPEPDPDMGPDDAIVLGQGLRGLREPLAALDCGNSGTTLRLLCGILAGAGIEATLIGDASLSRRPMERVAKPLRALGAVIETGAAGRPPVVVRRGAALRGGTIASEVASAQVKSAVLLAGLYAAGEVTVTEPERSRDHTERLLRQMGADLVVRGTSVTVRPPQALRPMALDVPGDLSSAAFLLAAVLAAPEGSAIELDHVGVNPTRAGFLDAMASFGARVKLELKGSASEPAAKLSATAQRLRGCELGGELVLRAIDEVPILAVLGALAEGTTTITSAQELRVKESDRLAQMATGLRALGVDVTELPDGLRITGAAAGGARRPLKGGAEIDAAHDHRIAIAFSIAALSADAPVTILGAEWADVSFPGFYELLRSLGAQVELIH